GISRRRTRETSKGRMRESEVGKQNHPPRLRILDGWQQQGLSLAALAGAASLENAAMRPAIYPCVSWLLLLSVTLAVAEEPQKSSPRDEYEALVTAQRDAEREFSRAYQAATTKEEKDRVSQGLGRQSSAQSHSDGFWKLIEKHPNDPVAIDTLMWLI